MLKAIRKHTESKCLDFGLSLGRGSPVCKDSRKFGDLGDPTTVFLALQGPLRSLYARRTLRSAASLHPAVARPLHLIVRRLRPSSEEFPEFLNREASILSDTTHRMR
jgi:hypothetical protein